MPKCNALKKHGGQHCVDIKMQNGRKKRGSGMLIKKC
jgi:hypothetical protein